MSIFWQDALKALWRHKMTIVLAYGLTFLCTVLVALQVFTMINDGIGNSAEALKLINGFDRTVFEDYMNGHKSWQEALSLPLFLSALLYIIISVFNNAGIIVGFKKEEKKVRQFIQNGLKYFLPFLAYAILFLLFILVIGFILFIAHSKILGHPIEDHDTEKPLFYSAIGFILLFVLKAGCVWIWSIKTRYHYVNGSSFFKSIFEGLKSLYKTKWRSLLILLLTLALFGICLWAHNLLIQYNSGQSYVKIILTMLALQFVLLLRYFIRAWAFKMMQV